MLKNIRFSIDFQYKISDLTKAIQHRSELYLPELAILPARIRSGTLRAIGSFNKSCPVDGKICRLNVGLKLPMKRRKRTL